MIKILTTAMLILLLAACTSQDKGEEKTFTTDKKVETKKAEKAEAEVPNNKVETYAKNIFELADIEGNTLHVDEAENGVIFQEHKGKVVFLLFFGHRCPPCLGEIPVLKELVKEKGDKLAVVGLEVQRLPEEQLKTFKKTKEINYTLLSGENPNNSQFISYIAQRAQWTGSIPFLVGIKPNGEVGVVHLGGMNKPTFEKVFEELSQ